MREVYTNPIISDIALDLGAWKLDEEWREHDMSNLQKSHRSERKRGTGRQLRNALRLSKQTSERSRKQVYDAQVRLARRVLH